MSFFKFVRVTILLTVLVIVAGNQWLTRARTSDWVKPLWMTVYPVVADNDADTLAFIDQLEPGSFDDIGDFIARQGASFGRALKTPLIIQIAPATHALPPAVPPGGNRLSIAVWSLKMRWWAWRQGRADGLPGADVRMFVLYRSGNGSEMLERSVGMQKGMYGIVNAYASRRMASRNRVILAHELLHVLGATDKYDLATGLPHVPEGLAEPGRSPLYPQEKAEIMGARIALSGSRSVMPRSLGYCVIGSQTAAEIGLLDF